MEKTEVKTGFNQLVVSLVEDLNVDIDHIDSALREELNNDLARGGIRVLESFGATDAALALVDVDHGIRSRFFIDAKTGVESLGEDVRSLITQSAITRFRKQLGEQTDNGIGTEGLMDGAVGAAGVAVISKLGKIGLIATTIGAYKAHLSFLIATLISGTVTIAAGLDLKDRVLGNDIYGTAEQFKKTVGQMRQVIDTCNHLESIPVPEDGCSNSAILKFNQAVHADTTKLISLGVPMRRDGGPKLNPTAAVPSLFTKPYMHVTLQESGWTDKTVPAALASMKDVQREIDQSSVKKLDHAEHSDPAIRKANMIRMRALLRANRYMVFLIHQTSILFRSLEHVSKKETKK